MKQRNTPSHFVPLSCGTNASTPSPAAPSVLTYLCPLKVVFLQFSISAMFMWMLCEGIHLNNVLTVSVFKNHFKTYYFYIIGWSKSKRKNKHLFQIVGFSCTFLYYLELEYCYVLERKWTKVSETLKWWDVNVFIRYADVGQIIIIWNIITLLMGLDMQWWS